MLTESFPPLHRLPNVPNLPLYDHSANNQQNTIIAYSFLIYIFFLFLLVHLLLLDSLLHTQVFVLVFCTLRQIMPLHRPISAEYWPRLGFQSTERSTNSPACPKRRAPPFQTRNQMSRVNPDKTAHIASCPWILLFNLQVLGCTTQLTVTGRSWRWCPYHRLLSCRPSRLWPAGQGPTFSFTLTS